MRKSRKYDLVTKTITYIAGFISMATLFIIIAFTLSNGLGLLSFDLIKGDFYSSTFSVSFVDYKYANEKYEYYLPNNTYYSEKWGVALSDSKSKEGKKVITVSYISDNSPFNNPIDTNGVLVDKIPIGSEIGSYIMTDNDTAYSSRGAKMMIEVLNSANTITDLQYTTPSGGIRGSLISTGYLIILTLLIVVPFGILASIYINEYSKGGRVVKTLTTMIDMLSGIPSIIFGLLGAAIFIPFVNSLTRVQGSSGSLYAGALTMSVILLPIIIKTTIEGLKTVPDELRCASLALGASNTQTTFKVVLPNAIVGITSGVILSIGRIVGESAALIFAMGTTISDKIVLSERSTTLAVHIWTVMSGEIPNYELGSTIALIILVFVLAINLSIKLLTKKFSKLK